MAKNKQTYKLGRLLLLAVPVLAVAVAIGAALWYHHNSHNQSDAQPAILTTKSGAKVNLAPPTKADTQSTDDNKQRIVDKSHQGSSQPSDGAKRTVMPVISYAGQQSDGIEVGSYVSGIVESGGTCTATFKNSDSSFTKSVTGVVNSSTVSCPTITVLLSSFTEKGNWTVTVSYASAAAQGVSAAQTISVQ